MPHSREGWSVQNAYSSEYSDIHAMGWDALETVLQNLDEMLGFDPLLLRYHCHNIQIFKIKQINNKSDPNLVTKK